MTIFEQVLFTYLGVAVLYTLVLAIAGQFKKNPSFNKDNPGRIAILVPAYKEDGVIVHVAESHLKLNYPADKFDVYILADSLKDETIEKLNQLSVNTIVVSFEKSTKAKSLNAAFAQITEPYEMALICDADNILEPDFLYKINTAYNKGHKVIQARRVAKNMNTSFAVLDGASEVINNHLFRKGYNALGLSSALIGSGMVFNFDYIKNLFKNINAVGGFDKILQLDIVESGEKIFYLSNALVYDEKIDSADAFQNQRKRWLHSQFSYAAKYFKKGILMLFKGNIDYFNLGVLYFLFPTRMLLLGTLGLLAMIFTALHFLAGLEMLQWWALFVMYSFSLGICLPRTFYNKELFVAILNLPLVFVKTFALLFKLKGANKSFIHTSHSSREISTNIFNSDDSKS